MLTHRRMVFLACLALLRPVSLAAQGPEGGLPDPAKCNVYRRALETGNPAPFQAQARLGILSCGRDAGHAYASWFARMDAGTTRAEADSFLAIPYVLRDGELFLTALRIAGTAGAPSLLREVALIVLLNQSGSLWTGPISAYERGQACSLAEVSPAVDELRGAAPLPSDYLTQTASMFSASADSSETDPVVRSVALCVKKNLYRRTHYHRNAPPPLTPVQW